MILRKKPEASLKLRQPLMYRVGLVVALVLITGIMIAFPKFEEREVVQRKVDIILEVTDIPQIEQKIEAAKPPSRPSIPIESENEDLSEDITIDQTTDFDSYTAWEAPPPPPEQHSDEGEGPRVRFIPYDEPPEPIGGFAEIQKNIVYPEIAQEAGIEGTVVVQAYVNEYGVVTECTILKGMPNTGLEEAAIAAIKKTRFKPAKQRDRNVGVYISIPVIFKLKS
ncbi:MAG: energy transducer TonB [Candidatus Marinimicrobia bacterium]|jgi:protein TonB|nr:energy transducer TonB [Candidatus Neomarinimicrobiota bacterium]HNZ36713.1 energy transducer TonB [Candidatus Neomarinimicrobiota bacterium]HOG75036.1 energy transducer TonB [Candidatus Neomarinimicrobiota bacterium]HQM36814.1 energy transducer TonB [Candidatus Neomarinimicrobiota bacterium]HRD17561.1 energy transducer TonB [Candidatus Neomarinimicrobiota bacterium]